MQRIIGIVVRSGKHTIGQGRSYGRCRTVVPHPCSHLDVVPAGPVDRGSGRWARGGQLVGRRHPRRRRALVIVVLQGAEVEAHIVEVGIDLGLAGFELLHHLLEVGHSLVAFVAALNDADALEVEHPVLEVGDARLEVASLVVRYHGGGILRGGELLQRL